MNAELREATLARLARAQAAAAAGGASSSTVGGAAASATSAASGSGRRLCDGEVVRSGTVSEKVGAETSPKKKRKITKSGGSTKRTGAAADETLLALLDGIILSGVEDMPEEAKSATEVDCRTDDAEFVPEVKGGRIFTLRNGEGKLKDRKGECFERNVRHLTKSAGRIAAARARGEHVWVHCAQGINRGPAGLMAYLLLHTECMSLRAVHELVRSIRVKARCRKNTFAGELVHICEVVAGKPTGY